MKDKKKELTGWLADISFDVNALSKDAFINKNMENFHWRKNEILTQFAMVTAAIEALVNESEEN